MSLYLKHKETLELAVKALADRTYFSPYPEHPRAYGDEAIERGQLAYEAQEKKAFVGLEETGNCGFLGEEESPYSREKLGITYPAFKVEDLIENAVRTKKEWSKVAIEERAGLLIETLSRIIERFHEITWATYHTTGQSYPMSFQASGPHSADRALEAVAMAFTEMNRFPKTVLWEKPMGRSSIRLDKEFKAVPKGIGLIIGCSTFPTWNSLPGLFANLACGIPSIVKPHPQSVLPIAIYVAELQKVLKENGYDPCIVQLAVDSSAHLIAKELAEHSAVKVIDFTGSSEFGAYVESLKGKEVFTEKAGVNSVIIDSARDLRDVMRNLAFSVCLYSGQMCTAPQNFFIPETGVRTEGETLSYEAVVELLKNEISALALHPKMGPGTLGALNSEKTLARAKDLDGLGGKTILKSIRFKNFEYGLARLCAPSIVEYDAENESAYNKEMFGPVIFVIKTRSTDQSVEITRKLVEEKGALTCALYCDDEKKSREIIDTMNEVFAPVSLNLVGFFFVNQHAAFSDFHGTGANNAGTASYADPSFVNKRFAWVGNRWPSKV